MSSTPSPSRAASGVSITISSSRGGRGRGGSRGDDSALGTTLNSRAIGLREAGVPQGQQGRDQGGRDAAGRGTGRGGGGGGRHGGGRGRGAAGQHSVTLTTSRPLRVFTSDFDSFRKSCQNAVRYKVHRPNCSCPNVKTLLQSDHRRILHMVGSDDNTNSINEDEWFPEQVSNGLLVLPDVRSVSSVYFCLDTTGQIFDDDPTQTELKLQTELFPSNHPQLVQPTGSKNHLKPNNNNNKNYKVSCAACLLEDIPNGFACISSTHRDDVDKVRDRARQCADENSSKHSDHAHFVATLPVDALMKLDQTKTRSQIHLAQDEIVQLLINQGIPIEPETHEIKLQHHLSAFLGLFKDRNRQQTNEGNQDSSWHCLVLGFDDTKGTPRPHWSLDLPGGKRHLGENTLQAAIRETQEEMSLVWDADWIRDEWRGKGRSDFVNLYYMLSPPNNDA